MLDKPSLSLSYDIHGVVQGTLWSPKCCAAVFQPINIGYNESFSHSGRVTTLFEAPKTVARNATLMRVGGALKRRVFLFSDIDEVALVRRAFRSLALALISVFIIVVVVRNGFSLQRRGNLRDLARYPHHHPHCCKVRCSS